MNPKKVDSQKKLPLFRRPVGRCVIIIISLVILLFLTLLTGIAWYLEIIYHLLMGWVFFLLANLAALEVNFEMMACGVGALLLAVFGLQRLLVWVRKDKPWKLSWTISITALMLMLFAASISMTGIIHQLGWMIREPLTESNRGHNQAHNMSNARQISMLLIEYDFEYGELPQSLISLVEAGYIDMKSMAELGYIYLGAEQSMLSDESEGKFLILISPHPLREKWVILRSDGSVSAVKNDILQREYPELIKRLPNLLQNE